VGERRRFAGDHHRGREDALDRHRVGTSNAPRPQRCENSAKATAGFSGRQARHGGLPDIHGGVRAMPMSAFSPPAPPPPASSPTCDGRNSGKKKKKKKTCRPALLPSSMEPRGVWAAWDSQRLVPDVSLVPAKCRSSTGGFSQADGLPVRWPSRWWNDFFFLSCCRRSGFGCCAAISTSLAFLIAVRRRVARRAAGEVDRVSAAKR